MNRKNKFLIISTILIILIMGTALGINFVSNASIEEMAFGEEIEEIKNNMAVNVKTFPIATATNALTNLNSELDFSNEKYETGDRVEDNAMTDIYYTKSNVVCLDDDANFYGKNGTLEYGPTLKLFHHSRLYDMNQYIDFDETDGLTTKPTLFNDPTVFKHVFEANCNQNCDYYKPFKTYSNYNAVEIFNGDLKKVNYGIIRNIQESNITNVGNKTEGSYSYSLQYALAFAKNSSGNNIMTNSSDAQKVIWALIGTESYGSLTENQQKLYRSALAVEKFLNTEKRIRGNQPNITLPSGAEVGAAYYDYNGNLNDAREEISEDGEDHEGETIVVSGVVRIGPFVMKDYAYAFSKDVQHYSHAGLEYPHVLAGIVKGEVTIGGNTYEIKNKTEGNSSINGEVTIVYKDWYNQTADPYKVAADVRGDVNASRQKTISNTGDVLYLPSLTEGGAGKPNPGFSGGGATELFGGGANATSSELKVMIQDDSGAYTEEYPFPLPKSVFYIEVPALMCGTGGSEVKLTSINFTYRDIDLSAEGRIILPRAVESTITFTGSDYDDETDKPATARVITAETPCTRYSHFYNTNGNYESMSGCYCGGGHKSTLCHKCYCDDYCILDCSSDHHTSSCYTQKTCSDSNHKHDSSCSGKELTCTTSHAHSKPDCYKCCTCSGHYYTYGGTGCNGLCKCDGHGAGYSDDHGTTYCSHGHNVCKPAFWKVTNGSIKTIYGQPLLTPTRGTLNVTEEKKNYLPMDVIVIDSVSAHLTPVFIWHGWAEGLIGFDGISIDLGIFGKGFWNFLEGWQPGALKAAEIGDRVTYKAEIKHTASVPLFMWVRLKYPSALVADNASDPIVYTKRTSGGAFIEKGDTMVVEGKKRTNSARLRVDPGSGYYFFFTYTLTNKVGTQTVNGKKVSNSPSIEITTRDPKWKSHDNPDISYVNMDWVRTDYGGYGDPRHNGPVLRTVTVQKDQIAVKQYVININKYIYDVQHVKTKGTDTTISANHGRGYQFANGETNMYSLEGLKNKNTATEASKAGAPVYVEYGDKITYKIEVGNGKITERTQAGDFDYDVDEVYVTLVDELPKKYSNLKVTIDEASSPQGAHLRRSIPAASSESGGVIRFTDLKIPKNGVTTITIELVVEEHTKDTIEKNRAYIDPNANVYNSNREDGATIAQSRTDLTYDEKLSICEVSAETTVIGESCDYYKLNDYDIDIDKYISSYKSNVHDYNESAGFTSEKPKLAYPGLDENGLGGNTQPANEDLQRMDMTDDEKKNDPVQVERTDQLIYSIKLENNSKTTGTGGYTNSQDPATQVRVSKIIEEIDPGLEITDVKAYIYNASRVKSREVPVTITPNTWGATRYEFVLDHTTVTLLEPKEFIVFYVTATVNESNMSLNKLENKATIAVLTNINTPGSTTPASDPKVARIVKEENGYNENSSTQQESKEIVRTKDLVISGKVWLDKDRDGKMEAEDLSLLTAKEKELYRANGSMAGKAGVEVRLYKEGATTPLRVTYTDGNGEYTFSKTSGGGWYQNSFNSSGNTGVSRDGKTYQRVDKAEKDAYGNYLNQYINYYIEFVYDGVLYKSTELYSRPNYDAMSRADQGMTNLIGDGNYNDNYLYDSNAAENKDVRETFNTKYEYITYNTALTGLNGGMNPGGTLEFDKIDHASLLKENPERAMLARTFINDETKADNYLWLYKGDGKTGPNTEYLKYINLGLELREEVDISLTKDVYKVKTTINGETMEYSFNENYGLNGVGAGLGGSNPAANEYLNDFIIAKPYGLELYESDYKYRADQYFADKVIEYKGIASELNVEVTYRITVDNKPISDDDEVKKTKDYVTETNLLVKVNEIMDVYEDNFIKYGARPNNEITVKTKNASGYLEDLKVKTIEAWYYKDVGDGNGNYRRLKEETPTQKPTYEEFAGGRYQKVDLIVSDTSNFRDNGTNYTSYGYNKLFISGMDGEFISEDNGLDIYVKYTLDKEKATLEQNNRNYAETMSKKDFQYTSAKLGDNYATYTQTITVEESSSTVEVERSLKIMESVLRNKAIERGIENIAQVNAYSVWYDNGDPASLVDRNSNAGNQINPDDISTYEDTTYKTGIAIVASGTGWDKEDALTNIHEDIEFNIIPDITRHINGVVWDDVRNDTLGTGNEVQHVGDGLKNSAAQNNKDLMNENVELNYRPEDNIKEDKDFGIRNVKVEFIEIVKMPDASSETGERYYEQILEEVTWDQQQNIRTNTDGSYELYGLIPGTYVVRFTYGDVADVNIGKLGENFNPNDPVQKDMLIFNGQDYKSTKAQVITETRMDDILDKLEIEGGSDARDDERRRLEVNSYSEVMTNPKAEILKGVGNGKQRADNTYLTTNKEKNSNTELAVLANKTHMFAETVEFLVKPEKLTEDQINQREGELRALLGNDYEVSYEFLLDLLEDEKVNREFKINHIDFGLEYRPESEIRLVKEIEEVKLITEDKQVLVDLFFLTKGEGTDTKHEIDKERSKGLELIQFVSNNYNILLSNLTNEERQGFVFVQIDEEILQGCTVQINYKFEAENNSQVDRIAVNLEKIRYKENPAAKDLLAEYPKAAELAKTDYTASGVAAKVVETDMYMREPDGQKLEYRIRPKVLVSEGATAEEMKEAYYGRFVGYGYYTGEESDLDTIASLKFDKIMDYVDVNLEYKQDSELDLTTDKFWTRVKTVDLKDHLKQLIKLDEADIKELQNGRGYDYKTLLVSVDDRIKDDAYTVKYTSMKDEITDTNPSIRNNDLSRFLLPLNTVADKNNKEEKAKAVATIRLPLTKVLSAESDKDDMTYENVAEIIQFTTLTGRRTNFATTIGNADIAGTVPDETKGEREFVAAITEHDTAATETVTLIPPTGLMRNRRAIVNVVQATSVGVGIVFILGTIAVILIMIITIVLFVIRKYKKRRII